MLFTVVDRTGRLVLYRGCAILLRERAPVQDGSLIRALGTSSLDTVMPFTGIEPSWVLPIGVPIDPIPADCDILLSDPANLEWSVMTMQWRYHDQRRPEAPRMAGRCLGLQWGSAPPNPDALRVLAATMRPALSDVLADLLYSGTTGTTEESVYPPDDLQQDRRHGEPLRSSTDFRGRKLSLRKGKP